MQGGDETAPGDDAVLVQVRHHAGGGLALAGVGAESRSEGVGRFRLRRAAMVAQHGHHVRHADAARLFFQQIPAALAAGFAAGLRVFGIFAQVAGEVQSLLVTQRAAGELEVAAQARGV